MSSNEIDCFLRRRLRNFDGVFSIDPNLPDDRHLTVLQYRLVYVLVDEEGRGDFFSTSSDVDLTPISNVIRIVTVRRRTPIDSCRVISISFVDTVVFVYRFIVGGTSTLSISEL